jgi:4-amino-4-deoxychorismate lyase
MSSQIKVLSQSEWISILTNKKSEPRKNYFAMYSTWWGGIVTDPSLMLLPIDDHQVHRGDAVFEAMKSVNGKIYLEQEHLDRLDRSAHAISLKNPLNRNQMKEILHETLKVAKKVSGHKDAILRLYLSRGPGSFSPSPYDTEGAQVYLVVTKLQPYSQQKIETGVSLALSKVLPKEPWLAQIKSCNYLQNVFMKKEAVDLGVDFTVGVNLEGFITEGSTENLVILTKNGDLLRPKSETVLMGTTMLRAFELAKNLAGIKSCQEKSFTIQDLKEAQEVMMIGTTIDVLSVTKFENTPIGDGKPGLISQKLCKLIMEDQV